MDWIGGEYVVLVYGSSDEVGAVVVAAMMMMRW